MARKKKHPDLGMGFWVFVISAVITIVMAVLINGSTVYVGATFSGPLPGWSTLFVILFAFGGFLMFCGAFSTGNQLLIMGFTAVSLSIIGSFIHSLVVVGSGLTPLWVMTCLLGCIAPIIMIPSYISVRKRERTYS